MVRAPAPGALGGGMKPDHTARRSAVALLLSARFGGSWLRLELKTGGKIFYGALRYTADARTDVPLLASRADRRWWRHLPPQSQRWARWALLRAAANCVRIAAGRKPGWDGSDMTRRGLRAYCDEVADLMIKGIEHQLHGD